jgi:predicted TPR repeat methyltransferase
MRLGAENLSTMPQGYVRALFDQYAPRFDKVLVNDLDYRGPEVLLKAVLAARHAAKLRRISSARSISVRHRACGP